MSVWIVCVRLQSESEQYWNEHSVLSRTGSVKKIMGPEEGALSADEYATSYLLYQ